MLWYKFAFSTPFSCLALVLLICVSSLIVILVIFVRLMLFLVGHLVLFLLLLVRLLRGSTKHAWYAVFSSPCPTSVWYMSAQGSLVAVLKETRREVRELHRLLCTPHVSFSNVWQMEQNGRVAISDKMQAARQGGEWRWFERVCLCAGRSETRESMSYSHQVARLRDGARRFSIGASNLDSKDNIKEKHTCH